MAAIGFTLVPDGYAGPYVVNAIVILAFLLGIAHLTWRLPLVDIATCLIAAACVPVFWQTITEARPDLPWGLGLGLAVGAILHRSFLQRSSWSVAVLGVLCGLTVGIKPTAFAASLTCIGLTAGCQIVRDCLESDIPTFGAAIRRSCPPLLLFAAGLFSSTAAIIGINLFETVAYVLRAMIYDRDFWAIDESFRASLLHYLIGLDGNLALNFWLWIGLALIVMRAGLIFLYDRRDYGVATILAATLLAYAISTLPTNKSYFLGAMFYGVFIVTMTLNFGVVVADLDRALSRLTIKANLQRWLSSAVHIVPLAAVLSLFAANCFFGRIGLATRLNQDQIGDIRTATAEVWSLLQKKSLALDTTSPADRRVPLVSFSSPYPVTSTTIQLYAAQARITLHVRGEYFNRTIEAAEKALLESDVAIVTSSMPHNLPGPRMGDELISRMDANPGMCLVDALPLLAVRVIRIYRRADSGCSNLVPDPH